MSLINCIFNWQNSTYPDTKDSKIKVREADPNLDKAMKNDEDQFLMRHH